MSDKHTPGDRYADKRNINWAAVGKVVEKIGSEVALESFHDACVPECDGDFHQVNADLTGLSKAEIGIVCSWFGHASCVAGEEGVVADGRHRLWNSWSADPKLVLPVRSEVLVGLVEDPESRTWKVSACEAAEILGRLSEDCLARSPRYAKVLARHAEACPTA